MHVIDRVTTPPGNNRGNRYSHKHLRLKPSEDEYWNFSIDELARYAGCVLALESETKTSAGILILDFLHFHHATT